MVIDLRSILSDPLIVPRLIIWSVVVGVLSITVADPDLWGHVAFGRDIINTFELPVNDPYSFTADRPWVNHEWLSEVLMALAHQVAGPMGLSILKLTLLLTTFVLVMKELKARGVPPINRDVIAIVFLVGSLTLTRTVRPQTFSLLCAAILVMAIRRADERPRALWTIPVLMAVWANLHGGWLVGMGILSIAALDRVVTLRGAARLHWAVAMTASLVATLVTPYGVGLWLFLWRTVGLTRADISEWQSLADLSAAHWVPWMIVTIFAVIAFVRDRSRRASEVLLVLALMALSFKVWRVVTVLRGECGHAAGARSSCCSATVAAPTAPATSRRGIDSGWNGCHPLCNRECSRHRQECRVHSDGRSMDSRPTSSEVYSRCGPKWPHAHLV